MTPTLDTPELATTSLGAALLDAAELRPGHRVVDVGCGAGDTTLRAARRVGPRGLALGVDGSAPMVERARRRACEAGLANVGFIHADAGRHWFGALRFDVVVSERAFARCVSDSDGFGDVARSSSGRSSGIRHLRRS